MIPGNDPLIKQAGSAITTSKRLAPTSGQDVGAGAVAWAIVSQTYALLAVEHRLGQLVERIDAMTGMLDEKPMR